MCDIVTVGFYYYLNLPCQNSSINESRQYYKAILAQALRVIGLKKYQDVLLFIVLENFRMGKKQLYCRMIEYT